MLAVGDQLDIDRVVGEGRHGEAGRSVVDAGHRIEQVSRRRAPGGIAGACFRQVGCGVAHRYGDAPLS